MGWTADETEEGDDDEDEDGSDDDADMEIDDDKTDDRTDDGLHLEADTPAKSIETAAKTIVDRMMDEVAGHRIPGEVMMDANSETQQEHKQQRGKQRYTESM